MHSNKIEQVHAIDFILAGNSTFTLKSVKSGNWFTYKAEVKEMFGEKKVIIRLLSGSDNVHAYTYLCTIKMVSGIPQIFRENSKISATAMSFMAFDMVFYKLLLKQWIEGLEIWHEGRCGRCGRKLTVPESIETGYGPECAGRVKMFEL